MIDAIRVYVRYDLPSQKRPVMGEDGKTRRVMQSRREYYPDYQREAPPLDIPYAGQYLWNWYMDASRRLRRVLEGVCSPIPPSEWLAWQRLTGDVVYPWEYGILAAMDIAFCDELNTELEARRSAQQDEADQKAKQGKRR